MFSPTYIRRNSVADDPVEMLKKKLESASYSYKRDWALMFKHFDKDNSGSLDAEEFRLALRRVARVPASLLSDGDIRRLYDAIDDSQNGRIESREFVAFMNSGARESWSPSRRTPRSSASTPRKNSPRRHSPSRRLLESNQENLTDYHDQVRTLKQQVYERDDLISEMRTEIDNLRAKCQRLQRQLDENMLQQQHQKQHQVCCVALQCLLYMLSP